MDKSIEAKIESFFSKTSKWQNEYSELRKLILEFGLKEEYKWMHPCYSLQGKNVVLIHGFKDYCALLFFKGVLSKDKMGLLIQQTENVQDRRQMRFTSLSEIIALKEAIKDYIQEAIEIEKSGVKIEFKKTDEFKMADEFEQVLQDNQELKTAFQALTPGRQRAYLLYFAAPKQSKTRMSRIEKCIPMILKGKGLDDK
ncbi:MAG: DUF1801 domain-containing protein [Flavobacterium sp.]